MPIVNIQMVAGRPAAAKQQLIHEVAKTVVRVLQAPEHTVRVIVSEVAPENWGVGLQTKAELDAAPKSGDKNK